jgi:hypothetical protein
VRGRGVFITLVAIVVLTLALSVPALATGGDRAEDRVETSFQNSNYCFRSASTFAGCRALFNNEDTGAGNTSQAERQAERFFSNSRTCSNNPGACNTYFRNEDSSRGERNTGDS